MHGALEAASLGGEASHNGMGSHVHCGGGGGGGTVPAFSALHLLRSYNHLLSQPVDAYQQLVSSRSQEVCCPQMVAEPVVQFGLPGAGLVSHSLLGALHPYPPLLPFVPDHATCPLLTRAVPAPGAGKRPRSEKRPIPEEQKDEKYFERRKRNNRAAKKSRDARKIREDQIALRAAFLEQENAFLRTQVLTLREESQALRHLLLQRKIDHSPHIPAQ